MANTPNYNLYVTSGNTDTFADWRAQIAGETNSNMTKIDTALAGKQASISANGILKGNGSGTISAAVAGTDYQAPLTAGTDYATPASVSAVTQLIPSEATTANKLADKNYVNSSVENVAAYYITKNAGGDPFATKAELTAATTFYSGGSVRVPTRNDYTIVLADESKTITATQEDPTTRYIYNNGWEFQYIVNNSGLTAAQWATVNVTGLSTANGILKGNGSGAVSTATVDSSPTYGNTSNLVSSDGVYTAVNNITPHTYTVTAPTTGWTDDTANSGYYTITLTVQGLKASYTYANPVVDVVLSGTDSSADDTLVSEFSAMRVIQTGANSLTIKTLEVPTDAVPLKINTWG